MAPNNALSIHGNEKTMNLNTLILTNIQSSPYFKVNLFGLKTYHEVIDEIYYKVSHLEPWEKGSRKTAGQTGMCGGVRGVGAGGIVSSAYCLLYKLFTLKLTRKQVVGLLTHTDSPYIRGLGFMYIRYTQPPADLWEWYEEYLEDEEELDVKAGGGHIMTIGEMVRQFMCKLEWYSTLFPRIPVPVQKSIEANLKTLQPVVVAREPEQEPCPVQQRDRVPDEGEPHFGEAERIARLHKSRSSSRDRQAASDRRRSPHRRPSPPFDIAREIDRERERQHKDRPRRSRSRERRRSRSRERYKSSRDKDRHSDRRRSRSREKRDRRKSRTPDRRRRSHSRDKKASHKYSRESSFDRDLRKARERLKHSRDRSNDR